MDNIEKAIEKQEEIISYFRVITSPTDFEQKARDVLAVLKEHEPTILTLEEIVKSEIVWNEWTSVDGYIEPMFFNRIDRDGDFAFTETNGGAIYFTPKEYNDSWRCWSARPTEGQRKAEPWER